MNNLYRLYEELLKEGKGCATCGDTATTNCDDCGKGLCEFCVKRQQMRVMCKDCYNKRNEGRIKDGEFGADVMPMNNGIINTVGNVMKTNVLRLYENILNEDAMMNIAIASYVIGQIMNIYFKRKRKKIYNKSELIKIIGTLMIEAQKKLDKSLTKDIYKFLNLLSDKVMSGEIKDVYDLEAEIKKANNGR